MQYRFHAAMRPRKETIIGPLHSFDRRSLKRLEKELEQIVRELEPEKDRVAEGGIRGAFASALVTGVLRTLG